MPFVSPSRMCIGTGLPCTMRVVFVVIVVVIVIVVLQVPDETIWILLLCFSYAVRAGLACWFCGLIVVVT